jgi:hypothetical protein
MKKILVPIKNYFSKTHTELSALEILESKKERMKAELESLSQLELLLKNLNKH